jgi:hypothetical protein
MFDEVIAVRRPDVDEDLVAAARTGVLEIDDRDLVHVAGRGEAEAGVELAVELQPQTLARIHRGAVDARVIAEHVLLVVVGGLTRGHHRLRRVTARRRLLTRDGHRSIEATVPFAEIAGFEAAVERQTGRANRWQSQACADRAQRGQHDRFVELHDY